MEFFLPLVITGIMVGSIYALVALDAEREQRTSAKLNGQIRASVAFRCCPL